jgi:hypothetical protein
VTSCIVDSATIYIMVVKFIITICPPPTQLSLHRRAALSSNSNGTRSVYSRKNPKSSLPILWDVYAANSQAGEQKRSGGGGPRQEEHHGGDGRLGQYQDQHPPHLLRGQIKVQWGGGGCLFIQKWTCEAHWTNATLNIKIDEHWKKWTSDSWTLNSRILESWSFCSCTLISSKMLRCI